MQALQGFLNIFKIKDLRDRILFTLGLLAVYRMGGFIPLPGINSVAIADFFSNTSNNLFGLYNTFVGGALERASIFSLGIMPYISASIIIQIMGAVIPSIQALQRQGQEGKNKLGQWTRYLTIVLAFFQGFGIGNWLFSQATSTGQSLVVSGMGRTSFVLLTALTLTAGSMFIVWLGEQITARGIGNGTSLIIFIGIMAQMPRAVFSEAELVLSGERSIPMLAVILLLVLAVTVFIIFVDQGTRRIPLQSPKRVVGRKVMGGANSFLPFKVNTAGVMPVIFASAILFVPMQIATWMPNWSAAQTFGAAFLPGHWVYSLTFSLMIVFFAYFYTAIIYNPKEIAENLKKSGGFIPGVRPGRRTAEFVDQILTRVVLPGAIFLAVISVVPLHLKDAFNMTFYIGGTSVLIAIGVSLDTLRQLQTHLQNQHYDGFLSRGKIRGRRGF
ncbi:MAG: preprotein translocase, SecY subunit [Fibrobacteria bacterium]|jgi:preprotein translocase subunit SecY|nr:preprotein translocase, SecY subunit [Fibrobacteria bacterium]